MLPPEETECTTVEKKPLKHFLICGFEPPEQLTSQLKYALVTPSSAIYSSLCSLIGNSAVQSAEELPSEWQQRLIATLKPGHSLPCLVTPTNPAELAEVLTYTAQENLRILPTGHGSKLSWGGLVDGVELLVSTARLNRLVDHAAGDLTVTLEAGMGLAELQQILGSTNQFVALDPSFPAQATLGGIVATRDAGALRHRYGGVRDMVLGISFVRADGQAVKAGGRVVKNVAGYDLMKLLTGSYGSLGVITELTLRLYPKPETGEILLISGAATHLAHLQQQLLASTLTPTTMDILSASLVRMLGVDAEMGILLNFQGLAASVRYQVQQLHSLVQEIQPQAAGLQIDSWPESAQASEQINAQLQAALWPPSPEPAQVVCKIGCLPAQAIASVAAITTCCQAKDVQVWLQMHTSNGVGCLRLLAPEVQLPGLIETMRQTCEQAQGYLTVLQAPVSLKQTVDVWGYRGNALEVMRKIKKQFDPQQRLSPHRFVGGL